MKQSEILAEELPIRFFTEDKMQVIQSPGVIFRSQYVRFVQESFFLSLENIPFLQEFLRSFSTGHGNSFPFTETSSFCAR
jgi:hypothetical protein